MARLDQINARVGARRSRLMGPEGLRELLICPTQAARLELLLHSGRLPALPGEADGDPLTVVEAMLHAGLRSDEALLLRDVEGARPRRLLSAALGLQDRQALKALLRRTAAGAGSEQPTPIVAVSAASPERLPEEIVGAPSPEALAERLAAARSPFAEPLRAALRERDRLGLLPAEVAIDRIAFSRVAGAVERGEDGARLQDWLATLADVRNATTLLAMGAATPVLDLFVPGGTRMGADAFSRLAGASLDARRAAVAALVPCPSDRLVEPSSAERLLESSATRRLTLAARRAPLSLAVPLAWIEARREEIHRIALVLRGAALGLPGELILELAEA
jgi:V/A-type H+-transporting ATPase subunit C